MRARPAAPPPAGPVPPAAGAPREPAPRRTRRRWWAAAAPVPARRGALLLRARISPRAPVAPRDVRTVPALRSGDQVRHGRGPAPPVAWGPWQVQGPPSALVPEPALAVAREPAEER